MPRFPPVLKKESALVVPPRRIFAEAVAVPPMRTSSVILAGETALAFLCQ